ncbi:hypothetical protein P0082_00050 [Candidatus Haliotispira prima]|uniref:Uncharacterized protein n=1 Tax=Candidatus Haliotispira prima TaxID=3034016 RepID=A0ABY8MJ95_9SPIO|nr:hypothetical protein P0082_00050 [Candidatus Haliotispira prima]
MVSSVQLEMSSTLAITNIGAVIRLATEAAPTKAEAETNAGYVSLEITANSPRKFSISQHYGSDFEDGFTLADVLAANTDYKLYLFFEPNAIKPSETNIQGATLANDVATLFFTTESLPPAGDGVWARSLAGEQFVGSLPEWSYSQNQKGVFVVYAQVLNNFQSATFSILSADDAVLYTFGTFAVGSFSPNSLSFSDFSKLGVSYPDAENYYYMIGAEKNDKLSGKMFLFENVSGTESRQIQVPLNRY